MSRTARPLLIESPLERHGRMLLLAYDQGIEHGPADFDDDSVDPTYVMDIAEQAKFSGVVLQKGLAAAYYAAGHYTVPLVVKLNGRTNLAPGKDLYAPLTCTVAEAAELKAKAVGYTLYLGSSFETQMVSELANIVRDAHERKLPVLVWMNTKSLKVEELHRDILAYAGRIALELGADYAILPYNGSVADYAWVVESAGRCKVLSPGGQYQAGDDSANLARSVLQAGGVGLVVGRKVWQAPDPLAVAKSLHAVVWPEGGRPHAKI